MNPHDFAKSGIPLVHAGIGSPACELLAMDRSAEGYETARELWVDFSSGLVPMIESLEGCTDTQQLREELHSIRGTSAQFGLFLLEIFLFYWEVRESDPLAVLSRHLPGAIAIARLSMEAVETEFPHLRGV